MSVEEVSVDCVIAVDLQSFVVTFQYAACSTEPVLDDLRRTMLLEAEILTVLPDYHRLMPSTLSDRLNMIFKLPNLQQLLFSLVVDGLPFDVESAGCVLVWIGWSCLNNLKRSSQLSPTTVRSQIHQS